MWNYHTGQWDDEAEPEPETDYDEPLGELDKDWQLAKALQSDFNNIHNGSRPRRAASSTNMNENLLSALQEQKAMKEKEKVYKEKGITVAHALKLDKEAKQLSKPQAPGLALGPKLIKPNPQHEEVVVLTKRPLSSSLP